jgi:hypothetical protein
MQRDFFTSPTLSGANQGLLGAGAGLLGMPVASNPLLSGLSQSAGARQGGNPYLDQMAGGMVRQQMQGLTEGALPAIRDGAMAAGGIGGSRQGVAEGLAVGRTMQGLGDSLAGLYGNAYQFDQNLGLQQQGLNNSFFTAQRGQDLQGLGLGAGLVQQGLSGMAAQGAGLANVGQQATAAQWAPYQTAAGLVGPFTGLGGSSTSTTPGASPLGGALGGALAGAQLWNLYQRGG